MIEKLERRIRVEKGLTQDIKISCPPEQSEIVSKINELIDVVNELQKNYDNVCVWVGEQNLKTPAENVLTKSLRMDKEFAEDECVRLQNELEHTRKALDVAKTHLGYIKNNYHSWTPYRDEQMIAQASNCLAKIKELEDGNL